VRCRELASVLGAVGVERRIIARLRAHSLRLGVSGARRRPATGWQSLTPTELQVAELVGQGMTSRQIATRLFISPRTVQTHISHSLRKLDLTSRVELATTVARRQA
jgi:DNA-binding CsgD family transcriptional regulator